MLSGWEGIRGLTGSIVAACGLITQRRDQLRNRKKITLCFYRVSILININITTKKALSETQTLRARAGCSKVRTPPARPPQTHKPTDRTDYKFTIHCAAAR